MKHLVQTALAAALIGFSTNIDAAPVNGINYDPAHSQAWITAQQNNDAGTLRRLLTQDLAQIKLMNFAVIKTFFSQYCPINGQNCINVADVAQPLGLQVLLGVREFTTLVGDSCGNDCPAWTATQVQSAISQANNSPQTIIGIVVGNEDMFDFAGNPWNADNAAKLCPNLTRPADCDMQGRIVADINNIRQQTAQKVPVTTSQRQPDWCGGSQPGCAPDRTNSLNQQDPANVLGNVPVIGANIYPYWSPDHIPEKTGCNGGSAALCTQPTAQNLLNALGAKGVTGVIVTEEGWPSCYVQGSMQNPTNIDDEIDYFSTWSRHEGQKFDSYYFATYDKLGANCTGKSPESDADKHFGLCSASELGSTKDSRLITCP
jgi:exo-beta-1,3-glucanase (GH17 family)